MDTSVGRPFVLVGNDSCCYGLGLLVYIYTEFENDKVDKVIAHLINGSLNHQGLEYGEMLIMHLLGLKLGF